MSFRTTCFSGFLVVCALAGAACGADETAPRRRLRAVGVPSGAVYGPIGESQLRVMEAFRQRHPDVTLAPATGIDIPGRGMDTQPLMQIAGDVSPDVLYVNFRQSDTYIRNKFLHPLDRYIERAAGATIKDGHLLDTPAYYAALERGSHFDAAMRERMPRIVWDVIRRRCPHELDCPYVKAWGGTPAEAHSHVWAVPQNQLVMALFYRRDIFAEAGLPDRVPETVDELMDWARLVTHPADNTFGLSIPTDDTGWRTLGFLYSFGGRAVSQGENGVWRCVFDSEEAVEAYTFVARLFLEPFTNRHGSFSGTVGSGDLSMPGAKYAMWFDYLDQRAFESIDPNTVGFGPVPKGPTGLRGSEYNCMMHGLYAGNVDDDPARRDLAWDYVWFNGGEEANAIYARTFVENGLGRFVRPSLLRRAGYPDEADAVPPGWEDAYAAALEVGVPEPYGRNCQLVYTYMSRGIDQILNDDGVKRLVREDGNSAAVRERVREILEYRVENANQKMLGNLPDDVRRFRRRVAAVAVSVIALAFGFVFRRVFKVFGAVRAKQGGGERNPLRAGLAWLMMLPALGTIAVWAYWPLARGTLMAFQDYNVRGFTEWVGLENFAMVLFSPDFWHSIGVSLKYTALYMTFGFAAPILLALLLSEVPRGKILFRTIYYLPAVLSGVVVMFLWKGFYGPQGMINQLVNQLVAFSNGVFGTAFPELAENWLSNPDTALFACLLPTIWAGMGPGCLIYLAAFKTVPDDIYEAAEIDGAGILGKVRHIALPSIRMLIAINFVGAIIGAMKSGSEFIMAMTGGGPYTPYGTTEVIGLHIFWEAFGYLRFGPATAMAWVLGSMLIGFTVFQLQRLSQMEFRTAGR